MIVYQMNSEIDEILSEFTPRRKNSIMLSESYERLNYLSKSERVKQCGTFLEFYHELALDGTIDESGFLHHANFCKDRLCPLCSWRRSLKFFGQVNEVVNNLGDDYTFAFMTLTVPNCKSDKLDSTIRQLYTGFRKLIRRKQFKSVLKGFLRSIEVTYNIDRNDFHPHIHCILALEKSYVCGRNYISKRVLSSLWTSAFYGSQESNDRQDLITDIRLCYSKLDDDNTSLGSAVAEAAKYAVKPYDYLQLDLDLTDELVEVFTNSLFRKRMFQFGGCFYDVYKKLYQDAKDDAESDDADLIFDGSRFNPLMYHYVTRFGWCANGYKFVGSHVEPPVIDSGNLPDQNIILKE